MADTAYQIQYRQQFVAGFEQNQSLLRDCVTTEATIKGNQATFLVADSGDATTVTRGVNGLIPSRADNLSQPVATLTEEHDLAQRTGFNLFASQGDGKRIMQMSTAAVLNRKLDDQIITELNTGTVTAGAAATASMTLVTRAKSILGSSGVPLDGNVCAVITPAFEAYLTDLTKYGSSDFVSTKPLQDGSVSWSDQPKVHMWLGVKWIVHPNLPGINTAAEKCFMFHRSAIGHAMDVDGMSLVPGYNDEQDYSFCRATAYMGAKLLQNTGVVVMNHDGSAMAPV